MINIILKHSFMVKNKFLLIKIETNQYIYQHVYAPEPLENCHLNVKKLPKIVIFSPKIAIGNFQERQVCNTTTNLVHHVNHPARHTVTVVGTTLIPARAQAPQSQHTWGDKVQSIKHLSDVNVGENIKKINTCLPTYSRGEIYTYKNN